jgi:hypothetical protein
MRRWNNLLRQYPGGFVEYSPDGSTPLGNWYPLPHPDCSDPFCLCSTCCNEETNCDNCNDCTFCTIGRYCTFCPLCKEDKDWQYVEYPYGYAPSGRGHILRRRPWGYSEYDQDGNTVGHWNVGNEFRFVKIDGADHSRLLSGAEFALFSIDGTFVSPVLELGDGLYGLNDLDPGEYFIVETAPPQGYRPSDIEYHFLVILGHGTVTWRDPMISIPGNVSTAIPNTRAASALPHVPWSPEVAGNGDGDDNSNDDPAEDNDTPDTELPPDDTPTEVPPSSTPNYPSDYSPDNEAQGNDPSHNLPDSSSNTDTSADDYDLDANNATDTDQGENTTDPNDTTQSEENNTNSALDNNNSDTDSDSLEPNNPNHVLIPDGSGYGYIEVDPDTGNVYGRWTNSDDASGNGSWAFVEYPPGLSFDPELQRLFVYYNGTYGYHLFNIDSDDLLGSFQLISDSDIPYWYYLAIPDGISLSDLSHHLINTLHGFVEVDATGRPIGIWMQIHDEESGLVWSFFIYPDNLHMQSYLHYLIPGDGFPNHWLEVNPFGDEIGEWRWQQNAQGIWEWVFTLFGAFIEVVASPWLIRNSLTLTLVSLPIFSLVYYYRRYRQRLLST